MLQSYDPCSSLGMPLAVLSRILGAAQLVAAHRVGRQEASFLHSSNSAEGFRKPGLPDRLVASVKFPGQVFMQGCSKPPEARNVRSRKPRPKQQPRGIKWTRQLAIQTSLQQGAWPFLSEKGKQQLLRRLAVRVPLLQICSIHQAISNADQVQKLLKKVGGGLLESKWIQRPFRQGSEALGRRR